MMWKASDVNENEEYRLHFCESIDGDRFIRLMNINSECSGKLQDDVVFISAPISKSENYALKRRNLLTLSKIVKLEDGQPFFVDAHGIWLTKLEADEMDDNVNFNKIHWATGRIPKFPTR